MKKLFGILFIVFIFFGFVNFSDAVAPTISSFAPTEGKIGDTVVIKGENFMGINRIFFGSTEVPSSDFHVDSITQITSKVPIGAIDGLITVMTQNSGDAVSHTFKVTSGINNIVKKPITLAAREITNNSVIIDISGSLDKNSYDLYLYDSSIYYLKDTKKEIFALAHKNIDSINPAYEGISVSFPGLKLDQTSSYIAVLGFEDGAPLLSFKIPIDANDGMYNINILSSTSTSVDFEVTGLAPHSSYELEVINNVSATPNTQFTFKKAFSPLTTEEGTVLSEKLSISGGLSAGNNYIAILYKDGKSVYRKAFVTEVATPAVAMDETKSKIKNDCGIVPCCNVGVVDSKTGQFPIPCDFNYFMMLLNNIIKFLLFTIATPLIALIIMYTGYLYISAGGNAGQTEKVRHILFNAVVGYVIALAAWLIINTIITSFKIDTSINTFMDQSALQK